MDGLNDRTFGQYFGEVDLPESMRQEGQPVDLTMLAVETVNLGLERGGWFIAFPMGSSVQLLRAGNRQRVVH